MSYSITIQGHTRNEHNAKVKEIAEEAWRKAAGLHAEDETAPTLSGYSGDSTGSITLATPTGSTEDAPAAPSESAGAGGDATPA